MFVHAIAEMCLKTELQLWREWQLAELTSATEPSSAKPWAMKNLSHAWLEKQLSLLSIERDHIANWLKSYISEAEQLNFCIWLGLVHSSQPSKAMRKLFLEKALRQEGRARDSLGGRE